jgi:acetyl-CoA carboxylase carboxyltransferase component
MGGEQAANVLLTVRLDQLRQRGATLSPEEQDTFRAPIVERYEQEGSPYFSTARLWDDGVIDPVDTRTVLALGISAALNAPIPESRFGVFRM